MRYIFLAVFFIISSRLLAQQANFTDDYRGEVLRSAQIMPRFPGCENSGLTADEVQRCAVKKLLGFIEEQIQYPTSARQKGVDGVVVLEVTVDTAGQLTHPEVIISRGEGLDQEALRILKLMPRWIPAENYGKKVEVFFRIPFQFKLK